MDTTHESPNVCPKCGMLVPWNDLYLDDGRVLHVPDWFCPYCFTKVYGLDQLMESMKYEKSKSVPR